MYNQFWLAKIIKTWGYERVVEGNPFYRLKYLYINKNSGNILPHYHKIKYETFFVVSGKIELKQYEFYSQNLLCVRSSIMEKNNFLSISPGTIHTFESLEKDSVILEISNMDDSNDSYRINAPIKHTILGEKYMKPKIARNVNTTILPDNVEKPKIDKKKLSKPKKRTKKNAKN